MHTYDTHKFYKHSAQVILALCWLIGSCAGIEAGVRCEAFVSAGLRMACRISNLVLPLAVLLPICFVWLAGQRSLRVLIYPMLTMKAFFDGVIFACLSVSFGSAAWLVAPLLLLSDRVATICFIYLSSRCVENDAADLQRSFQCSFALVAGAIVLDCLFVAPYLTSIMS